MSTRDLRWSSTSVYKSMLTLRFVCVCVCARARVGVFVCECVCVRVCVCAQTHNTHTHTGAERGCGNDERGHSAPLHLQHASLSVCNPDGRDSERQGSRISKVMYPPPDMTRMYPPPHMTRMYPLPGRDCKRQGHRISTVFYTVTRKSSMQ
jgi:hypothetical protein